MLLCAVNDSTITCHFYLEFSHDFELYIFLPKAKLHIQNEFCSSRVQEVQLENESVKADSLRQ